MQAIVMNAYGPSDVLAQAEVATPTLGPDDVLVAQHATAIDPYDVKFRAGQMGKKLTPPLIPGSSVAGVIIGLGEQVTDFELGERVAANRHLRSNAEYVSVPQRLLARIPENVTFTTAAAVALSGQTGYQLVTHDAAIQPDEQVLILGGSGNVGIIAAQLANLRGTHVTTTVSSAHTSAVEDLLPEATVLDYRQVNFAQFTEHFDVIIDTVGGASFVESLQTLRPEGRAITIASDHEDQRVTSVYVKTDGQQLQSLLQLIGNGDVHVPIATVAPFNVHQLRALHDRSVQQSDFGKLVLSFKP
jgi:NADPH:quinone reductase-like Zn-dependent oxidoreductase